MRPRSRGPICPSSAKQSPSLCRRAQGRPDAGCTRGLVCSEESTRVRNHRFHRSDPAFPAQWWCGLYALSPESGLVSLRCLGVITQELIPASGHRDHAISPPALCAFVNCAQASIASRANTRDDREAPLCQVRGMGKTYTRFALLENRIFSRDRVDSSGKSELTARSALSS